MFPFDVVDFEVFEVGVDTDSDVGGKCPWSSRPCQKTCFRIRFQRKRHNDYKLAPNY